MGLVVFHVNYRHILSTIMKFIILAIGAVSASDSKAVTCDECQAAVGDLVTRLLGEESLAEQIAILKLVVCPQLPAEIDCETVLDTWYADMAGCIYNHFMLEQDVCALLGLCSQRGLVRDWTCEECTDFLSRDDTIAEGVTYLQGECFCGQDGHTDDCPNLVQTVLPVALPVLAAALNEQAVELCQEVVGVC